MLRLRLEFSMRHYAYCGNQHKRQYSFRFNRKNTAKRGLPFYRLLENAMQVEPLTYKKPVQR